MCITARYHTRMPLSHACRQRHYQNVRCCSCACLTVVQSYRPPYLGHFWCFCFVHVEELPSSASDNNFVAFPGDPHRYLEDDEMAAAVQPFALSLARLRDLESLNVSGARARAVNDIDDCSSLVRCSRAALASQSQIRMRCCIVTT